MNIDIAKQLLKIAKELMSENISDNEAIELRKNGYFVIYNRGNDKVLFYTRDEDKAMEYVEKKRGTKLYKPLRKVTVTKDDIHELEKIRDRMKREQRGY